MVVTLRSSTGTNTDFYKDEPLLLSCQTENRPTQSIFKYGISFDDGMVKPDITGCLMLLTSASALTEKPDDVTVINEINGEMCEAVRVDSLWNMRLTVRIELALKSYTMSCRSQDLNEGENGTTVSQQTLKLEDVKGKIISWLNNIGKDREFNCDSKFTLHG